MENCKTAFSETLTEFGEEETTSTSDFFNYFVTFINDFSDTREKIRKKMEENEEEKKKHIPAGAVKVVSLSELEAARGLMKLYKH